MNTRKQPESFRELVDLLAQLIRDVEPETEEELDERIRDMGYDPNVIVVRLRAKINHAIDQSPLNWRNKQDQLEQKKSELHASSPSINKSRAQKEVRLQHLLQKHEGSGAVLAFRNLTTLSDSDLDYYLAQAEYLDEQHRKSIDRPSEE